MLSITDKMNRKALLKIFNHKTNENFLDTYEFFIDSLNPESESPRSVLISKERFWSNRITCYSLAFDLCVRYSPATTPVSPHNLFQFFIAFIQNPFKKAIMRNAGFVEEYDGERYSSTNTYCFIKKEFINYLTIKELEHWISYFKEHIQRFNESRSDDKN